MGYEGVEWVAGGGGGGEEVEFDFDALVRGLDLAIERYAFTSEIMSVMGE